MVNEICNRNKNTSFVLEIRDGLRGMKCANLYGPPCIHLHIKIAIDKIYLLLPLSYFMDCFVICKKTLNIGVHTVLVIVF